MAGQREYWLIKDDSVVSWGPLAQGNPDPLIHPDYLFSWAKEGKVLVEVQAKDGRRKVTQEMVEENVRSDSVGTLRMRFIHFDRLSFYDRARENGLTV